MKKILLFALAFIATNSLLAQNFTAGSIKYSVTSATAPRTVKVANHSSFTGAANIPEMVTNAGTTYSVTSIGANAFLRCTGLISVSIPTSVTSIESAAFNNCTGLTSISIPSSVTSIGSNAFETCTGLTSVNIPASVTSIASYTFNACTSLTSVSIPASVTSIGTEAFNYCIGLTSVNIPSSVTSIGSNAFAICLRLTSITVNWATPLAINANVFADVTLSDITLNIPTGTLAAYQAAAVWKNFKIFQPAPVVKIGDTFTAGGINYAVTSLAPLAVAVGNNQSFTGATATIPGTVTNAGTTYSVTSIGIGAFRDCTGLTSVSIPSSVKIIGATAFRNCTGLTSINIPSSVTIIEDQVFQSCTGLTSVIIPSSVTSVGTFAFGYCTGLTSVTIPSSVTTIGSGAFIDCKGLTSISIPSAVTSILFGAFSGCTGLTAVTVNWAIPLAIGADVFQGITLSNVALNVPASTAGLYDTAAVWTNFNIQGLVVAPIFGQRFTVDGINYIVTKATMPYEVAVAGNNSSFTGAANIPASVSNVGNAFAVTSIADNAFSNSGLTSISLPSSVTNIGAYSLGGCSALSSVSIPSSVTTIGDVAFLGCTGLTSVTVNWVTPLTIGSSVFLGITFANVSLNIPTGTLAAYQAAAVWKDFSNIKATLTNSTFNKTANINLYPNPSNGIFNLQLANDLQIEVYNNLGQLLSSEKMISGNNTINITDKAAGIYFLKANDGATISTYKMIKN